MAKAQSEAVQSWKGVTWSAVTKGMFQISLYLRDSLKHKTQV